MAVILGFFYISIDLSTTFDDGDDENTQKKSKTELGHKRNVTRVRVLIIVSALNTFVDVFIKDYMHAGLYFFIIDSVNDNDWSYRSGIVSIMVRR